MAGACTSSDLGRSALAMLPVLSGGQKLGMNALRRPIETQSLHLPDRVGIAARTRDLVSGARLRPRPGKGHQTSCPESEITPHLMYDCAQVPRLRTAASNFPQEPFAVDLETGRA